MTSEQFDRAFRAAIDRALAYADGELPERVPRAVSVELHGGGNRGARLSVEQAAKSLFLGPDRFYLIVDVAVKAVTPDETIVFVRASDHEPGPWSQTWDPQGAGPFKLLLPGRIEVLRA